MRCTKYATETNGNDESWQRTENPPGAAFLFRQIRTAGAPSPSPSPRPASAWLG